jgi:phosphomannomutase
VGDQTVQADMVEALAALRRKVVIGFVGGSDLAKQKEQLGENGSAVTTRGVAVATAPSSRST